MRPSLHLAAATAAGILSGTAAGPAGAQFTDRTVAAGLLRYTRSWGSALADVDGDGLLDLYAGHHIGLPVLYWNQGGGTFSWLAHPQPWTGPIDRHGPLILPLDADERPDLFVTHGGGGGATPEANEVYRNEDGRLFTPLAGALGMDDPPGRTRCASAADFDGDLLVDVWVGKAPRIGDASSLFRNDGSAFTDVAAAAGLDEPLGTVGGIWGDVDDDGDPDLLVGGEEFLRPTRLWRNDAGVFADASAIFSPPLPVISGADWGDFDLDGDLDLALCDGTIGEFDTWAEGDTVTWYFNTRYADDGVDGLTVPSAADTARAVFDWVGTTGSVPVRLGPGAVSPPAGSPVLLTDAYVGAPGFTPGVDLGIFVWRSAAGGSWEIRCSTPNVNYDEFAGRLWDGTPIAGVSATSLESPGFPPGAPRIWRNDGGVAFAEVSAALGLPAAMVNPRDVSWVDHDNDGDLDLHVVDMGTSADPNAPDALFRNDGAAFVDVTAAEGVAGGTAGLGDGAVWGDVDNDGDPDLYLKQGAGSPLYSRFGPTLFLRNDGERGNAIQLDLVGAAPNPAAVGAIVDVAAGGLRIRRRVRADSWRGYQDPLRVHAGIGDAAAADTVRITWPSGAVHEYLDVAPGVWTIREDEIVLASSQTDPPAAAGIRLSGPWPQPARGVQVLAVTGDADADVSVAVHDVTGRVVRRLHDGRLAAGTVRLPWDGRDEDGRPVAAGVYFLRVRGAAGSATVRSVRLR